jgi:hypothetical protein
MTVIPRDLKNAIGCCSGKSLVKGGDVLQAVLATRYQNAYPWTRSILPKHQQTCAMVS